MRHDVRNAILACMSKTKTSTDLIFFHPYKYGTLFPRILTRASKRVVNLKELI